MPVTGLDPNLDLRAWLDQVRALGELKEISGVSADLEIGTIVDILMANPGSPTVLFDAIPGYPAGRRVLGNVLTSPARVAISGGLDPTLSKIDLVRTWRGFNSANVLLPFHTVPDGPVLTCVQEGADINLCGFPAPRWHEEDGGRYIGTGCLVVMRDPDSGWVNTGAYRVQVHDEHTAGIMITRGRNGDQIMRKYWARGEACPVAVSLGQHPLFLMLAGIPIPEGVCEYDFVGGIVGQPVNVVETPRHKLPVPAHAELVIEGEIPPGELHHEGPFGEWTGYYAAPERDQPIIKLSTILHRPDPINLGVMPGLPPNDNTYYLNYLQSALVWDQVEKAGIPGVQGVWAHESGGGRMMLVLSIKQMYPGHSKQAGLVATACRSGAYVNHLTVVVDDDIDPTNTDQVIWALTSRVDAREDVEILRRMQASPLDPVAYPPGVQAFNARMVIDACRPWERLDSFPRVARATDALRATVRGKYPELFS
jgi:4-hydroxy-3-polyprenylbenzoate decarboxylase